MGRTVETRKAAIAWWRNLPSYQQYLKYKEVVNPLIANTSIKSLTSSQIETIWETHTDIITIEQKNGINALEWLTIMLIFLKLTIHPDLSWYFVLAPIWVSLCCMALVILGAWIYSLYERD